MASISPTTNITGALPPQDSTILPELPLPAAQPPAPPTTPPQRHRRDDAFANRLRASIGTVPPQAAVVPLAMHDYVNALFMPYKNGGNDAAIDELAASRAAALHGMGETVTNLQSLFSYAHAVDMSAHMATGASGALPFAIANAVGAQLPTWMPKVSVVNVGLLSGFLTYLLVHVGGSVNGRVTAHTPWLRPTDLHPAMEDALARLQPGMSQKYKEMSSFQGFPASFATLGELPTLAYLRSPRSGMIAQRIGGPTTALIGGSVVAGIDKTIEEEHSRSGPALVLASQSWETQLEQLQARHNMPNWHQRTGAALASGMRRVGTDIGDKLVSGLEDSVRQLRDHLPSTVLSAGIWSGGIALSNFASAQLGNYMRQHGASELAVAAATQLVFAASLSPINAAWTAVLAFGPAVDERFVRAVGRMREAVPVVAGDATAPRLTTPEESV